MSKAVFGVSDKVLGVTWPDSICSFIWRPLKPLYAAQDGFVQNVQNLAGGNSGATGMQWTTSTCEATVCQSVCAWARMSVWSWARCSLGCCLGRIYHYSYLLTAEMYNPSKYCAVGSSWVTTSASLDRWNLAGFNEQTEQKSYHTK